MMQQMYRQAELHLEEPQLGAQLTCKAGTSVDQHTEV